MPRTQRVAAQPGARHNVSVFTRFCEARDLVSNRDPAADPSEYSRLRDELVVGQLKLVRYLATKFANRGEPLDDLIQVGAVGLLKAIDRFDHGRGVGFTTYATPTIVGEIKRYFRDKGWAVRVPRRLQELNLAVNRAIERLTLSLGHSPTVDELAHELSVSQESILEAQELGGAYNLLSLDSELVGDGEKRSQTLGETLASPESGLELFEDKAILERAFHVLTRRERVILFLRYFDNLSQTETAKRLGVSQMHVSRLQQKAIEKLRAAIAEPTEPAAGPGG
ncbi:MAG: SigB/SigF/SigG family RNA polymerase sigma factor [Vulcanimicrobiaceae bacterium]